MELKFRAWHKVRKEMYEVYGFNEDFVFKKSSDGVGCDGNPDRREDVELLQFIGLKDSNAKEIYKGHVICSGEYQTWEWRGVIKFSHGVFGAEWLANVKSQSMFGSWGQKHNLRRLDDDILDRIIIIGNIYENPELLNQNQ